MTMNRVEKYARDVLNGKIKSGLSIRLSCERFLDDLQRENDDDFPYYFDVKEANKLIKFAECLTLAEGTDIKPLKLYPWQAFILGNLNGWRHKKDKNIRRFRESYTQVCRQQGKSMLNGVIATYYSNFSNYQYPQCYLTATKSDQAKIVFKEICKFLNADKELGELFKIKEWKSEIDCKVTKGTIRALGRDTSSIDGFRPYLGILDEYHAHPTDQMKKLLQDGQVKLEDCLLSCITTAGFNTNSPCYEHYKYCKSILEKTAINDKLFIFIAEMDKDDDIWDVNNWYKVAPCLQYDKTLLENMKTNSSMAKEKGGQELRNFMVKNLNMWLNGSLDNKYLDSQKFLDCGVNKDIEFLKDKNVIVGMDLSSGGDLTSISLEYKYINDDKETKYFIHQHSFIPKMRLQERIQTDKAPYDIWVDKGLITVTEGSNPYKTDYKYIISYLKELIDRYNIHIDYVAYDGHNASVFLSDLEEITDNLVEIKQSAKSLNDATCDFKLEVEAKNIEYNKNDELLIWSFNNAITTANSFGEIKLDKVSQKDRIDVCDAVICSHKMIFKSDVSIDINKHVNSWLDHMGW